jgi:hypothetical protein
LTVEEANALIRKISNSIKTISLEEAASILKDQMSLAKDIFSLSSQFRQGDFANIVKLAETVDLEAIKSVLRKDASAMEAIFQTQANAAKSQIDEAKALIEAGRITIGENGETITREYTELELRQLAAFDLMLQYYDDLAFKNSLETLD